MRLRADADKRVCGGTIEALDRHIEQVAEVIGQPLPQTASVDYVWTEDYECRTDHPGVSSCARWPRGSRPSLIFSPRLVNLHELAHTTHMLVLPESRAVLHEGFAYLFGHPTAPDRIWDSANDLDEAFSAGSLTPEQAHSAWIFMSRLVRTHGFDGLRDFWYAVPATPSVADVQVSPVRAAGRRPSATSAADVHAAYRDVFGSEAIDLVTPSGELDLIYGCVWVLCEEPLPWDGDVWRLEPPRSDCEEDPNAVGPIAIHSTRIVRYGTVELEPGTYEMSVDGDGFAFGTPCGHDCDPIAGVAPPFPIGAPPPFADDPTVILEVAETERWKMETVADLDRPGHALTIRRIDP